MGQLFRDTGIQRYSDTSIKHTPFLLKSTTKHNTHIIIPRHGTTKHILTHNICFKRHNAGSMPVVTRGPPTDVGQSSNAPRHPSKDHDARKGDSAGIKATAGVFPNDKRTVSRAWSPGSPRGGGGGHCQLSQQFGRMILTHRLGTEMRTGSASTNRPNYASQPLKTMSERLPQSSSARWQVPWEPP